MNVMDSLVKRVILLTFHFRTIQPSSIEPSWAQLYSWW